MAVRRRWAAGLVALAALWAAPGAPRAAEPAEGDVDTLLRMLSEQQRRLDEQDARLRQLEQAGPAQGFEFWGYGTVNYFQYDWRADPGKRAVLDLERFSIGMAKRISPRVRLEVEVEFEHGGTGATMEFDKREEFGEFEQDVEKGGEVEIEEFALEVTHEWLTLDWLWKFGHFTLPVGLVNKEHRPSEYFTVARTESETAILPSTWHETGASLALWRGPWRVEGGVVNGLDSTAFSSGNWVAPGRQGRFEQVNAENLATYLRLDVQPWEGVNLGGAWYRGNTRDNRPKADLQEPAAVTVTEVDVKVARGGWIVRGASITGRLQNADLVTRANKKLSNNLNVKRTPVASEARATFLGAGYDVLRVFGAGTQKLVLFAQYDTYDSMAAVTGTVVDNPFWQVYRRAFGINWHPVDGVVVKAESSEREHGTGEKDRTAALGFGVEF